MENNPFITTKKIYHPDDITGIHVKSIYRQQFAPLKGTDGDWYLRAQQFIDKVWNEYIKNNNNDNPVFPYEQPSNRIMFKDRTPEDLEAEAAWIQEAARVRPRNDANDLDLDRYDWLRKILRYDLADILDRGFKLKNNAIKLSCRDMGTIVEPSAEFMEQWKGKKKYRGRLAIRDRPYEYLYFHVPRYLSFKRMPSNFRICCITLGELGRIKLTMWID